MAKKDERKLEKTEYGDIVKDNTLIKRTLMVSAFPALVKEEIKDGKTVYSGFLPGFDFSEVEGVEELGRCTQQLQDLLDDNVEELVVFGKQLPDLPEDDELVALYPGHEILYLDINVYAYPDDLEAWNAEGCGCCDCEDCHDHEGHHHDCDCHHHDCDCDDDCDCDCDDDCDCGCHDHGDCDCDDDCNCHHDKCHCEDDCDCEHDHEHKGKKNCKKKK